MDNFTDQPGTSKQYNIHNNKMDTGSFSFHGQVQNIYLQNTAKPKNILSYNLPGKPEHEIVGRDHDVACILDLLKEERDENQKGRVVVTGIGGIGKTTLVATCARKWSMQPNAPFPNVAFLNAETQDSFGTSVKGLATLLRIDKSLPKSEILKQIACLYKNNTLLLVLDNIEELSIIDPVLELPHSIFILASSQNKGFGQHFHCYELQFLPKSDSEILIKSILGKDFMQTYLKRDSNFEKLLENLLKRFDGLPLPLAHAAAHVKQQVDDMCAFNDATRNMELYIKSMRKYLNEFDNIMLDHTFPNQFRTTDKKSAYIAIKMNIEKILDYSLDFPSVEAQLLTIFSIIDPDYINEDICRVLFDEHVLEPALINLKKYCLINDYRKHEKIYLAVHRITQKVVEILLNKYNIYVRKVFVYKMFDQDFKLTNNIYTKNILPTHESFQVVLDKFSSDELKRLIERAFSIFNKNVDITIEILRIAGCEVTSGMCKWPLPHKLVAATQMLVDDLFMIAALNKIGDLQTLDDRGVTLLHLAGTRKFTQNLTKFLIKKGLSINSQTKDNVTPLHVFAVSQQMKSYYSKFYRNNSIKLLLNPNGFTIFKDCFRKRSGADISAKNNEGNTPLHIALKTMYLFNDESPYNHDYLLDLIHKKSVREKNLEGDTPLHIFALLTFENHNAHFLKKLLKAGASFTIRNNNGDLPLDIAVRLNNKIAICHFSNHGANINQQNNAGDSVLHITVREALVCNEIVTMSKLIDTMSVILIHGGRTDIRNNQGETVCDIALAHGQECLVDWLKNFTKSVVNEKYLFWTDLAWDPFTKLFLKKYLYIVHICPYVFQNPLFFGPDL